MRILLDNNLDHRFGRLLAGHEVVHARRRGWQELRNGDLVAVAERAGFEVLITGDKNMRYQQNLSTRRISILTLGTRLITLIDIAPLVPEILRVLESLPEGAFVTIGE